MKRRNPYQSESLPTVYKQADALAGSADVLPLFSNTPVNATLPDVGIVEAVGTQPRLFDMPVEMGKRGKAAPVAPSLDALPLFETKGVES